MYDTSEKNIKENCPHCGANFFALKHPLKETDNFWVVCDVHPISKGHILIIPKSHLSCIGEYPPALYSEFINLYNEFSEFIEAKFGSVSTFEHGKIGQTVFHSHIHLVPFKGSSLEIVPEGVEKISKINDLNELVEIYKRDGAYLFFSIGKSLWIVDISIAAPRFFRDRFAAALGHTERGNWKEMRLNKELMLQANQDIKELEKAWSEFKTKK